MGFVPDDAEWWLADCVEAITVEGRRRVVRHINRRLVNATSADEAYRRAMALGRDANLEYRNEAGRKVQTRFLGLAELIVLHDGVEHGAEIEYFEKICASVASARSVVRRKNELSVFTPRARVPRAAADYVAADIMAGLRAHGVSRGLPPEAGNRRRRKAAGSDQ